MFTNNWMVEYIYKHLKTFFKYDFYDYVHSKLDNGAQGLRNI